MTIGATAFLLLIIGLLVSGLAVLMASGLLASGVALWFSGVFSGGLFLMMGGEVLAVVQWMIATVLGVSFAAHAITFGRWRGATAWGKAFLASLPLLFLIVWAVRQLDAELPTLRESAVTVVTLGRAAVEGHFLSLEMLMVLLLIAVVGAGVMGRPEVR